VGGRLHRGPRRLRVENLHYDLTEREVKELFERIGPVEAFDMLYDRAGRPEGIALVTYDDPRDAEYAIEKYDGERAAGLRLKVGIDREPLATSFRRPPPRAPSMFERIGPKRVERRAPSRRTVAARPPPSARANRGPAGRPHKTAEQLDAELDDYWVSQSKDEIPATNGQQPAQSATEMDTEMAD